MTQFKNARAERGAALLLVSFVMIVVLVGGLAAVAVTSGELSSSRGYRSRQVSEVCANIAIEKVRATMELPDLTAELSTSGSISVPGASLTYQVGHYGGAGEAAVRLLDAATFDSSSLDSGENITNALSPGGGQMKQLVAVTAVCPGTPSTGYPEREVEMIFMSRY